VGNPVLWTYVVTNTGTVVLTNVFVTDDQGVVVTAPKTELQPGESMTCTASGTAVAGQYANVGTVTATLPNGDPVTDSDPSHYFGETIWPAICLEVATNGENADLPPGPSILAGSPVTWTYLVTNTGDVTLSSVAVTDDQGVTVTCPKTSLAPGESMTCSATGIATTGQYSNVGTATGYPPVGPPVSDSDPSHYFGLAWTISIEVATNGQDADEPPGPTILVGDIVSWMYTVSNIGVRMLTNIAVTDDQGVAVSCPVTSLSPGESMICTANGIATAGQYANVGTVTATLPDESPVEDTDPSHYFGEERD
jgi:hypothetical protein